MMIQMRVIRKRRHQEWYSAQQIPRYAKYPHFLIRQMHDLMYKHHRAIKAGALNAEWNRRDQRLHRDGTDWQKERQSRRGEAKIPGQNGREKINPVDSLVRRKQVANDPACF